MVERIIIADDLTGALDAAAPFAMRGIATCVALNAHALPECLASGARIVSVSTDSREVEPALAHRAVKAVLARIPAGTALFKKVDSRLKGNIEAELDAIPHAHSLVVPAIPEFGRWMRNGQLGGFGVETPIDIANRLGRHAGHAVIPDISSAEDISRALAQPCDLLVGARGLARALAEAMAPEAPAPSLVLPSGRAYCVIGSTDPITGAQLENLRASDPAIAYVPAPNGRGAPQSGEANLTIIRATEGAEQIDGKSVAHALAETLSRLAPPPGSLLVLSGGATAQIILDRLGITMVELLGEALPGLPLCRAGDLTVVTKSGGFGPVDTLTRLFAPYLSSRSAVDHHVG